MPTRKKNRQQKSESFWDRIRVFFQDPPAQKRGNKKPDTRSIRFSLLYFVLAILVFVALQQYLIPAKSEEIIYSEFKRYAEEGKVKDLVIMTHVIKGTIARTKDGKQDVKFTCLRVEDPDLVKLLDEKGIDYEARLDNTWFASMLSWILPFILIILVWGFLLRRMMGPQGGMLSLGKNKAKIFAESEMNVKFQDVAGIDEAKTELEEVVEFLKTPDKYLRIGAKIPKGVLLVGPPGTGKTLLARAVAGESGVPFFNLSGSDFVEMFVGLGAARVRDLFQQAKTNAPCIIFIDELDALGKARGMNPVSSHDEREQTLNQLLVEMDGFAPNTGVIIMAATNRPELLDPALLRPGRFDRQVVVDRPDLHGREAILNVHAKDVKLAKDIDLGNIAGQTSGFVGADLANLVNEAALLAARRGKNQVEQEDFNEAIDRIIAGLEKKSRLMNKKEKEIVAYHESGHALVANSTPGADPVNKISIIPRGVAALGYTKQQPTEDRYLMTQSELMARIAILLGGRVAEEKIFGDVSTGAADDLQKATAIARSMVVEFGMSSELGLTAYQRNHGGSFFDVSFNQGKDYSEQTAQEIDEEVSKIIASVHKKVSTLLTKKLPKLKKLAKKLLENEILEGDELNKIMEN